MWTAPPAFRGTPSTSAPSSSAEPEPNAAGPWPFPRGGHGPARAPYPMVVSGTRGATLSRGHRRADDARRMPGAARPILSGLLTEMAARHDTRPHGTAGQRPGAASPRPRG